MTTAVKSRDLRTNVFAWVLLGVLLAIGGAAGADVKRVKSQTVYVPAYSHIYHGDRELPFYLAVTLSIRNTDQVYPITLLSVDYFDTEGKRIKSCLEGEMKLPPKGSFRYVIKESDKSGGSGANFVVKWKAEVAVTEPIVESVMISTATQQGISFSSRGQAIEESGDR